MSPEIAAFIDRAGLQIAVLLISILLIGILAGMTLEQFLAARRRKAWRQKNHWTRDQKPSDAKTSAKPTLVSSEPPPPAKRLDAADQLRIVMAADFAIQPLLNRSEARLFRELDKVVIGCNPDWQVMAQVSLGEILRSRDADAYTCINSKRVDLLLVDEDCRPREAIEYQGGAHHQGTAAARDAVKKEALRRAGIGYHEVVAGRTTPSELRRLVEKLVPKPPVVS